MVIYEPASLHERVANRRPHKLKSSLDQRLRHVIRDIRLARQDIISLHDWLILHELPNKFIKFLALLRHRLIRLRIIDDGLDLSAVPNNSSLSKY